MRKRVIDAGWFGLLVTLTGRTNLSIRGSHQRGKPLGAKMPRPDGGYYTLRRKTSQDNIKGVNALMRHMSHGRRSYMVTHTMTPEWSADDRRACWRRWVDRVRKEPEMVAYQWMTEVHTGEGANHGTIHHHMILVMSGYWNYKPHVQRWSRRYSNSKNGLDIQAMSAPGGDYLIDDLAYIAKTVKGGATMGLPFRWWGCSQVARQVTMTGPVECREVKHPNCGQVSMRVEYAVSTPACAIATEERVAIKKGREIALRLKRRRKKAVRIPIVGRLKRVARRDQVARLEQYIASIALAKHQHLKEEQRAKKVQTALARRRPKYGAVEDADWCRWMDLYDRESNEVRISQDEYWSANRGIRDPDYPAHSFGLELVS